MDKNTKTVLIIILVVVVACLFLACICGVLGFWAYREVKNNPDLFQVTSEWTYDNNSPTEILPTEISPVEPPPTVTPRPEKPGDQQMADETLSILNTTIIPSADPRLLAERFKGLKNLPETYVDPSAPYSVGAEKSFWVLSSDTNEYSKIDAVLEYSTPHLYFWIQKGVEYDSGDLKQLCKEFENKIYPTDREFFGSEWTPGVDGDEHLYIIYSNGLGENIAGYFSSNDSLTPKTDEHSNGHETFVMSATQNLADTYTYGILAHEFQHMIHWYRDRNEESWLNEGFSELAVFLNGYGSGDKAFIYTADPDIQITNWPNDPSAYAHNAYYGSAFMIVNYFLDRFGEKATQALVGEQSNGLASLDDVFQQLNIRDETTGNFETADQFFADWTITNYLGDADIADGRYAYKNYPDQPFPQPTETIDECPLSAQSRTVNQYGVDYIAISCPGTHTLTLKGSRFTSMLPADAHSGEYAFWSNKSDESDSSLSQTFDLSSVSGQVDLKYYTWYDLEKDYDYLYVLASENGQDWNILNTPGCTTTNPAGNNYGCGYNSVSSGWVEETVDLSAYAGKQVTIKFEYVTDAAVTGEGFLLDDVTIPQAGYQTDFEQNDGGWKADGFVRIANVLKQTYKVSLIKQGTKNSVETLVLDENQQVSVPVEIGGEVSSVVLVVSGTTRYTRQAANYQFEIK